MSDDGHYSWVGAVLAISGNLFISFAVICQKLAHNAIQVAEESGVNRSYLSLPTWWLGFILMFCGEAGNFMAYGFAPASSVAALGTISLISNAIIAPIYLKERIRPRGAIGILLAIVGSSAVVWSTASKKESAVTLEEIWILLGELKFWIFVFVTCGLIALFSFFSIKIGQKSVMVDVTLIAAYGAFTIISTKALSSVLSSGFTEALTHWLTYVLIIIVAISAVMQLKYLNLALSRFDSTEVLPTQFVLFNLSAICSSAVVYDDFRDLQVLYMCVFLVACVFNFVGIFLISSDHSKNTHRPIHTSTTSLALSHEHRISDRDPFKRSVYFQEALVWSTEGNTSSEFNSRTQLLESSSRHKASLSSIVNSVAKAINQKNGTAVFYDMVNGQPSSSFYRIRPSIADERGIASVPSVEYSDSNDSPGMTIFVNPLSVPWERRRQTIAVLIWLLVPLIVMSLNIVFAFNFLFIFLPYLCWAYCIDDYIQNDQMWYKFRAWKVFDDFKDYFPITLWPNDAKLEPDTPVLVGYHPHGIISMGCSSCFISESHDISNVFPDHTFRVCTLNGHFNIPLWREVIKWLGYMPVDRHSIRQKLGMTFQNKKYALVVVLGGAEEALDAHPETYDLVLRKRKGFFKIALETGSCIVPVLSFGENDIYLQMSNPRGSLLRKMQLNILRYLTFSTPLLLGRGIFNYKFGLLPQRRPINVVFGTPIKVVKKEMPSFDDINSLQEEYIQQLMNLYEKFKEKFAKGRKLSMRIVE